VAPSPEYHSKVLPCALTVMPPCSNDANKNLYGEKIDAKAIVFDGAVPAPESASKLITTLDKASPENKSKD
jgi:Las17-binding protein actin regulator